MIASRHSSLYRPEHRRVVRLQHPPVAEIHMHAARQARVEAADSAHDVNALELLGRVLLEDWRILYSILIWTRCTVDVTRAGIPWRRWIGVVVGNLAAADDDVM